MFSKFSSQQNDNVKGVVPMVDESVVSFYKEDDDTDDGVEKVGEDVEEGPADESSPKATTTSSCFTSAVRWVSDVLFVFSTTVYVWSAFYLYSDQHQPAPLLQVQTDSDLQVWFVANSNSPQSSVVTHDMIYQFAACFGYALVGVLNLRDNVVVYGLWTVAAVVGMAAAAFLEKDDGLSRILYAVAAHLFCLSALSMSFILCKSSSSSSSRRCGCPPRNTVLLYVANALLVAGTLVDVVLSYFGFWMDSVSNFLTEYDMLIVAMAGAGCWWTSSVLNLTQTTLEEGCCCSGRGGVLGCCRLEPGRHEPTGNAKDGDGEDRAEDWHGQPPNDIDNDVDIVYHDDDDDDDDSSSYDHRNARRRDGGGSSYLPYKTPFLKPDPTEDTANDEEASITSFWSEGPATKDGIAPSSLDSIFGR
jgi:hypothetical protein